MTPVNAADRKRTFLSFLLFFALTTLLIVVAVYFGMQVPFRQNERLKQQVAAFEKEKDFMQSFSSRMGDTKRLLDSVNRAGVQAELVDGKISENLKNMNAMVDADSASVKKFYEDVVQNFNDLQYAKKQLRDASGKDANLLQNNQTIESLRSELNQAKTENIQLRQQMMSIPQQPR